MEENKTITIMGKTINYGNLSDDKLVQLYKELNAKEELINKRLLEFGKNVNI